MKKLNFVLAALLLLTSTYSLASIFKIYNTATKKYIPLSKLIEVLPDDGIIVLGEFHNDDLIQKAQASIISKKTQAARQEGNISLYWEFLNFTDQLKIDDEFTHFLEGEITSNQFITNTAGSNNLSYSPLLEELKKLAGQIFGINLPRSIKQKVIADGIDSIDPIFVPHHHYNGDESYRERFVQAMEGHVPASKIEAYFTAQCLTDSVMADTISRKILTGLNFLVAGSFHTDFFNGTVMRLNSLVNRNISTLKLINLNQLSEQIIQEYIQGHKKYGRYADFIIMVK
jgi:uncharacterized iron-regulated protein